MEPQTVHGARGAGTVVSKGLVAVAIFGLVAGVEGHLEARGAVLDKHGELLVNHPPGWLNGELQAPLLSVHPEARQEKLKRKAPMLRSMCVSQPRA